MNKMKYYYPFGEELKQVVQQDRTPKKVFVLGVYASAVHAKWKREGKVVCKDQPKFPVHALLILNNVVSLPHEGRRYDMGVSSQGFERRV